MVKLTTTSTTDLQKLADKYDIDMQVFSVLELNKRNLTNCIINADDKGGQGTHWISVYAGDNQDYVIFFDPFGMPPDERIIDYMKQNNDHRETIAITTQAQALSATSCGYWCIYFLNSMDTMVSPGHFLSKIDPVDQSKNERMLRNFFN